MNNNTVAALVLGWCFVLGALLLGGIYTRPLLLARNPSAWLIVNRFTGEGWICGLNFECHPAATFSQHLPSDPTPEWTPQILGDWLDEEETPRPQR